MDRRRPEIDRVSLIELAKQKRSRAGQLRAEVLEHRILEGQKAGDFRQLVLRISCCRQ